jgi:hypothetical protein
MDTKISNEDTLQRQNSQVDEAGNEQTQKRPFVRPVLTRHATLPAVTATFFGTFSVPR